MADRRKRSYFPSIDSRFTGALEPSPNTGSYYNPARYANQGFSRPELSRIQSNLSNVYNQDLQYNRVANPQYQTIQDTGYGSTDQFGSGRASAATTQNYARQFGTPTGNGLSTFQTPSGGSITYRPSGRTLSGGAQPTVSPDSAVPQSPQLAQFNQNAAYAQGYGALPGQIQSSPSGPVLSQGGVSNPVENLNPQQRGQFGVQTALQTYFPAISSLQGAVNLGQTLFNRANQYFNNQGQPSQPQQNQYVQSPQQPRRYFDY